MGANIKVHTAYNAAMIAILAIFLAEILFMFYLGFFIKKCLPKTFFAEVFYHFYLFL
jgi:hypothetical protein